MYWQISQKMIFRITAQLVSVLFHPLLLPTYATFIILWSFPDSFIFSGIDSQVLLLRTIFNTFLLPSIIILMMVPLKLIKSIHMEERQERLIPYVAVLFFYIWTFVSFYKEGVTPPIFNIVILGALISVVLSFLTNVLFLKISIHTVGMGVLVGLMLSVLPSADVNLMPLLLVIIIIAGLVGTARLILISHNQKEIYIGYLIGILSQLLAIRILML